MRTLILAFGLMFCAACRVSGQDSDRPPDVSLWSSAADLSPYYRAAIREATEKYRGDIGNEVTKVVTRIYIAGRPWLWAQVDPDPIR